MHGMNSVVDWRCFAVWEDGKLVRSLSLSPDGSIEENIGEPFDFERPYWDGKHPAEPVPVAKPQNAALPTPPRPAWTSSQTESLLAYDFIVTVTLAGTRVYALMGIEHPSLGSGVLPLHGHPRGQPEPP